MEDRKEEKNHCKKCKTVIDDKYDYCVICNDEENIEIAVVNKYPDDSNKTINFFKLKLIDMFRHPNKNKIILSFTRNNAHIADTIIRETNFFYSQDLRYAIKERQRNSQMELELIKAPLRLISPVVAFKKDREERKLRWYD